MDLDIEAIRRSWHSPDETIVNCALDMLRRELKNMIDVKIHESEQRMAYNIRNILEEKGIELSEEEFESIFY